MELHRVFIKDADLRAELVEIHGEDAHRITRVLRMREGETLTVCDMAGNDAVVSLTEFHSDYVVGRIESVMPSVGEPPYKITLYQSLPKADKMELILQKAVELGVYRVVPYISERTVSRPDEKSYRGKEKRWEKIMHDAAMQSGRGILPLLSPLMSYKEALNDAKSNSSLILFCYEGEGTKQLGSIIENEKENISAAAFIGPEGGFSSSECEEAKEAGAVLTGLGKRILRTETAGFFLLSSFVCRYER